MDTKTKMTRTVKISDEIHRKIRVLSVLKDMPMQELIEKLLKRGLRSKQYDNLLEELVEHQAPATASQAA